jgi:hypothetical protein
LPDRRVRLSSPIENFVLISFSPSQAPASTAMAASFHDYFS